MSKSNAPHPDNQPNHVTKIRVMGADTGSPKYNDVLDRYRGLIGQFLRSQHQQVEISGQRYYKSSQTWDGARVMYQNNEGQDTLWIIPETAEAGGEQSAEQEDYWQFAIIETTIPGLDLTTAEMCAFMDPTPPRKNGYAVDGDAPADMPHPPLAYPSPEIATSLGGAGTGIDQVSSLRVDLRPFPGGVKFDLYGYIHPYADPDGYGPVIGADYRAAVTANHITETGTVGSPPTPWPAPADVSGRTLSAVKYKNTLPEIIVHDFPTLAGSTFTSVTSLPTPGGLGSEQGPPYGGHFISWSSNPMPTDINAAALISAAGGVFSETTTVQADGYTKIVRGLGALDYYFNGTTNVLLNGAGPTQSQGNYGINFYDYTLYWVGDHAPLYVYPTRDAVVRFAVFDGEPDAYTDQPKRRWESSKMFPKRWPLRSLGTAAMSSIDDPPSPTPENHFGMLKLGTVIIHPKKGKGGIKFIAA